MDYDGEIGGMGVDERRIYLSGMRLGLPWGSSPEVLGRMLDFVEPIADSACTRMW